MSGTVLSTHHIAIRSHDFDRSLAFYTRTLGLKQVFARGEGANRMAFLQMPDGNRIELFANGDRTEPSGGWIHLALTVDSVDDIYRKTLADGAVSRSEPVDAVLRGEPDDIAIRVAFVVGPDGEVLEFVETQDA